MPAGALRQDPGQFGLVSIAYAASIKLLELLANFAGAGSGAFDLQLCIKPSVFLVLNFVLMIVPSLALNFALCFFWCYCKLCAHVCTFSGAKCCAHDCAFSIKYNLKPNK